MSRRKAIGANAGCKGTIKTQIYFNKKNFYLNVQKISAVSILFL